MTEPGASTQCFARGEDVEVPVDAIEPELARLWRKLSSSGAAVMRACLWNLVVRTEDEDTFGRARATIDVVAAACPARVIVLRIEPQSRPGLRAKVACNSHVAPDGGKLLASEEITIEAFGADEQHLPALVRSLLQADVPTAFWLASPARAEQRQRRPLVASIDRLISDTGDRGGRGALLDLGELSGLARTLEVADLGWLRTAPWRALFASLFDPPVGAGPLAVAKRITIRCRPTASASARMLLGWIADRMRWGQAAPRPGVSSSWLWTRPGGQVTADLRAQSPAGPAIQELSLESEDGGRFGITYDGFRFLELWGTGLPLRRLPATERSEGELMVAALGASGHDPLLPAAMARAAELVDDAA